MSKPDTPVTKTQATNFIRDIIRADVEAGKLAAEAVVTRFPPEPNGYLHIGHAKSICVNFGLAQQFGGQCNLRFDDTNPSKEEQEYVDAIMDDVRWLGFTWAGEVRYASDYFDQFYAWAQHLIREGRAYVCDLSAEQASEYRGWATSPGKPSPYRERSAEENLDLLERMKHGEFDEGAKVLRAKIDMASPNMNLRDPILYRIRKQSHHHTGDTWCIYPSYDFAHGQEDAIEGVTHSICTLEFADHRPLYDWFLEQLPVPSRPRQYEFGRLNLDYTVTSKRKLKRLVDEGHVDGWDDPRMPTIHGMRRRGFTARAIRNFCDALPVAKSDGVVSVAQFESAVRDDLDRHAPRGMAVLNPLKVIVENFSEDRVESLSAARHPKEDMGERILPFTRELYIDTADFTEDTTLSRKKFKRLVLGDYVRLRGAYVIKANRVEHDVNGSPAVLYAELVENTVGEDPPEGIKPRGVIHWVSATEGRQATIRVYERLFITASPDKGEGDLLDHINPESKRIITNAWIEPALAEANPESSFQFEREGYFVADRFDHCAESPVFNMTIGLRDTFSEKPGGQ
ncbi:MAG TPA: glutamine--tRNA ligase [Spongiibacteraceae bacterium]|nr:glutamine--tRNA ligase [Spongiibacteraceae bacterium]HCS28056.1 glutamine--tRNA ligase [Spongiibacteraceae bacterium]|tara:strand:+ start:754 stop:2460 length:1707 start_codon:yes stop_codon:yes gene_type:complete